LYNIHLEFGIPTKVVRLIKMCLNGTYGKVHTGKHLFNKFPIQNGLKGFIAISFQLCFRICHSEDPGNHVELILNAPHQLLSMLLM
jgi:hypothetical protein